MEVKIIKVFETKEYERLGYTVFRIDRHTVVGNPFGMGSEADRNKVCDDYQIYFNKKMESKIDEGFVTYVEEICEAAKKNKIALACWCAPKRCHGETIKAYIESLI